MISRRIIDLTRVYNNNHKRKTVQNLFFSQNKNFTVSKLRGHRSQIILRKRGGGKKSIIYTKSWTNEIANRNF